MGAWEQHSTRLVYRNPFVEVHEDVLEGPRGGAVAYLRLVSPAFACVVAVTEDRKIVFVQNYRPALRTSLLELPGGRLEPKERPERAARRELEEETGYRAADLMPLGWYYPSPFRSGSRGYLFLARKLRPGTPHPEASEDLKVVEMPIAQVYRQLRNGRIHDSAALIGLSLAERRIGQGSASEPARPDPGVRRARAIVKRSRGR